MTDLKHDPDGVPSGPEAIARARREIEAIRAEILAAGAGRCSGREFLQN